MNPVIATNSFWMVVLGLATIAGAVIAAIMLPAFWPLVFVLVGLLLAFRIDRNNVDVKKTELLRRGATIIRVGDAFYGLFGSHLVYGKWKLADLLAAESFLDGAQGTAPVEYEGPRTSKVESWQLKEIDRIEFTSDSPTFTIVSQGRELLRKTGQTAQRNQVLGLLERAGTWRTDQRTSLEFKLNLFTAISCLLLMFFTCAVAFTSLGLIQPNQLPLATWNDLNRVKGKAAGVMLVWVLLCESYKFLINNLPAAAAFIIGSLATFALAALLYRSQWTTRTYTIWRNPGRG